MPTWSEIAARPANYWQGLSGPSTGPDVTALLAALLAAPAAPIALLPGSATAPGLTVQSDPNTGLFSPGADQLALATGGVRRALLTTAALQLDLPLTGTAVTQAYDDATAGRLLKVGDFGIGLAAPALITDIDAATTPGTYRLILPAAGTLPAWLPASGTYYLEVRSVSATGRMQRLRSAAQSAYGTAERLMAAGVWGAWRIVMPEALVGTVAQTSGAPTGAVIERGSNANGSYTRWADGTQECWTTLTTATGATTGWTFPAVFSAAPAVQGNALASVLSAVCLDSAPTTTTAWFSARDKTDARRADTCHVKATGRWF